MRRCVEESQEDGVLSNDLSHTQSACGGSAVSPCAVTDALQHNPKRCSMVKAQRR